MKKSEPSAYFLRMTTACDFEERTLLWLLSLDGRRRVDMSTRGMAEIGKDGAICLLAKQAII